MPSSPGSYLSVSVYAGNLSSSNTPFLVNYAQPVGSSSSSTGVQGSVYIQSLSGCASEAGRCMAGQQLVLTGGGFTNDMAVTVFTNNQYYGCDYVDYSSSSRLVCYLPAIPVSSTVVASVQLWLGSYYSNGMQFYYFPTPSSSSSSSSTGPAVVPATPSSKSGLTMDDLIVIVLVVVIVVGLLLVCQVMYCLHHFAGVKFPRLARLTGGRLFAVAEVEAAEVDLSLLAHDHQHQQPMLRAVQPQPQPQPMQSPPPMAAASYQLPGYYMPPQPAQPIPNGQYPAATGPAPYLYPRSFVPSAQYYQPAS